MSRHSNSQIAGIFIAFSSILSIALMAQHPTINTTEITSQVVETVSEMKRNKMVHGGLVALLILHLSAFTIYSISRGLQNLLVLMALVTYIMSIIMMSGAALINGFIFPNFLQDIAVNNQHLLELSPLINTYSWNFNQTLSSASVVATSCAITLWSLNLFHSNLRQNLLAVIGLGIGVAIAILMLGGWLALDLIGMTSVVIAQSLWNMGLAYLLISKSIN